MNCYTERAHLLALLAVQFTSVGYLDPEGERGYDHVIAIKLGSRWLCWHISDEDLDLFSHVRMVDREGIYDGHSTEDKYAHIRNVIDHPYSMP